MKPLPPIFVLGHASRSGLILPYLSRLSHSLFINPDYSYEGITMHPTYEGKCPLTHYRVFRGWKNMADAFLKTGEPVGLFFEDDAVPNRLDWKEIVNDCVPFMENFDLMYLCGRLYNPKRFDVVGFAGHAPIRTIKAGVGNPEHFGGRNHVFGCCAALMTRRGADRMVSMPWGGIPGDVIFPDSMNFAFVGMDKSPFNHDSSQGSLIDPKVPKYLL